MKERKIIETGELDCGRKFVIEHSRKNAPGLDAGTHLIASFEEGNKILELPESDFMELVSRAFVCGYYHSLTSGTPGGLRVGYNGPHAGRNDHAHAHVILPGESDKLPRIVGLDNDTTPDESLVRYLSSDQQYMIGRSSSKSPGLFKGRHYIAVLVDNPTSCIDLSVGTFLKLLLKAHQFADTMCFRKGHYRIVFNGPKTGSMKHAHVHIILPEVGDVLPYFVKRSNDGGDKIS